MSPKFLKFERVWDAAEIFQILQKSERKIMKLNKTGSAITNGTEPRSCLGRVFNFKLGSFTDNTKIVQHANDHL
jgi:hypothetical protein